MEKRVFLAIALSLLVLTLYQVFLVPPTAVPATGVIPEAAAPPAGSGAISPSQPPNTAASGVPSSAAPVGVPVAVNPLARDIVVETDTVRAVFSTQGAVLTRWQLKQFPDSNGQFVDLVPTNMPAPILRPFSLATDDPILTAQLAAAVYQASTSDLSLGSNAGVLSFDYHDDSGLNVHKSFQFQPKKGQPYLLTVEASIDVSGAAKPVTIQMGPSVGLGYSEQARYGYPNQAVQERATKMERKSLGDLTTQPRYEGPFRFVGVGDHYFLSAALPGEKAVYVTYEAVEVPVPWNDQPLNRKRAFISYSLGFPGAASVPFFLGPKAFDTLRAVDTELVRSIDFGIFAFLVVPLLQALKWLNGYVGNFGWSIILLTVLINVVLFPLRHRSMVSMKKMQGLQPKIKAIQARYAKYKVTDPERQKMNSETMALYKENGVNPASGCVPMLLTMPILFAFYSLLAMSIEIRHAPFMGYIQDLSMPDKFWITPILMGVTMFWQQKMMPSTADPAQQKIFLFMPLIFTFSFIWAPSGLVLYWLMSNLMAISQQYLTNHLIGAKR